MYNVIKFQAPFERLKLYQTSPEISLLKSIITQAIIDSTNNSDMREAKKLAMEARDWIFGDSEDFKMICIEAGLEPSFVVKIAKETIKLHNDRNQFVLLKKIYA
jgi:hypothetical protein